MIDRQRDELDDLVRSLDDLDAEYAAGDLDPDDYHALRDDYTVRVADAVRMLDDGSRSAARPPTAAQPADTGSGPSQPETAAGSSKRLLVIGTLLIFALGAGWLLARSAGERGVNDALTGSIDESSRQRVARCQELGATEGQLLEALQCFDEVLTTDPDNVEALTYRAWFLVLASGSGSGASTEQQGELLASAQVYLDRAVDIDPTYPDARTFRAVVADRQGRSADVCAEIVELVALEPPPFFLQQTQALASRNGC